MRVVFHKHKMRHTHEKFELMNKDKESLLESVKSRRIAFLAALLWCNSRGRALKSIK